MEVKRGDRISLNTKKRLYYFQEGDGGINLSVDGAQVTIVPESATDMHLAQINHAIKAEQILIGWPENTVEMPEKDSDLLNLLSGGRNKVDEWIYALKDDKFVKANVKVYKIEKLVEFEKAGKNRKSVLNVAENVLRSIGGISPVEETEQEKIEIKLTSGNGEIPETT